nr:hypothetical protein Iba_chr09dCG0740 [Ipomoea batatas]GMD38108.1 hypothetical protein Iba_chr09fCG0780 [Ipomoea batatas]
MPKKESSTENNAPNQMRKQEMEACESQAWQQALVLLVPRQIVFEIYVNLLEQKKTSTCLQQGPRRACGPRNQQCKPGSGKPAAPTGRAPRLGCAVEDPRRSGSGHSQSFQLHRNVVAPVSDKEQTHDFGAAAVQRGVGLDIKLFAVNDRPLAIGTVVGDGSAVGVDLVDHRTRLIFLRFHEA